MRPLRRRIRVSGYYKGVSKRTYIRFSCYKDDVFFHESSTPVDYKEITAEQFVILTFKLQREGVSNLRWEVERKMP